MGFDNILQRRIKAIKDDSDDDEPGSILPESESESELANLGADDGPSAADSSEGGEFREQEGTNADAVSEHTPDTDSDTSPETLEDLTSISFGALVKAQESFGNLKRRRGEDSGSTSTLTKKLRLIHSASGVADSGIEEGQRNDGRNKKNNRDLSRSSKHAPAEQSSKKPVSRRRDVIPIAKLQRRDPRFEPLGGPGGRVDDERTKKNYAFLDTYRESEMTELRAAIRTSKDEQAKADWKRALLVMESRKKAEEAKERRQGVVRAHRAREKELVKQGKKPFYLKKAELQRRALVERFEGMGEKQVDKVIERRRKKTAATERKRIPEERRIPRRYQTDRVDKRGTAGWMRGET